MRNHIKRKHVTIDLENGSGAKQIKLDGFVKCVKEFESEVFEDLLLRFILLTNQTFLIVNSDAFRDFATYHRNQVKIPNNTTIGTRCTKRFEVEKELLTAQLQNAPGKIAIIIDCWTSKNMISFQGVIASWISAEWSYEEALLDLSILDGSHSGKELAASLVKEFEALANAQGIQFSPQEQRVSENSEDISDSDSDENSAEMSDNDVEFSDGSNVDETEVTSSMSIYSRIRHGISKIRKSPKLRAHFKNACKLENTKPKSLSLDGVTRWNSTYVMLKRVMEFRKPFEAVLRVSAAMSKFIVAEFEWKIVEQMLQLLTFQSKTTVHSYTTGNNNTEIVKAANAACTKLNKYYPSSDGLVYVMGLDPRCKFQWYKHVGIKGDVVKQNKQKAIECWNKNYKNEVQKSTAETSESTSLLASQMQGAKCSTVDQYRAYYSSPVVDATKTEDILIWWKDHEQDYPDVAAMARDFLAISGTGVPIERTFSFGSDLLTSN
ncbi:unnamed protein product, partial [Allacma fusca]